MFCHHSQVSVTFVTKCVKFDAQPVWSLWHILSRHGDKTCCKVHSLHVLSLLHQQHYKYNPSFPFLIVCARAHECVCVCPCARVDVHLSVAAGCCCVLCLLSPPQSALNWNSVLLWVDYEATAARSSVSCVKYDYRDWVKMWFDCVLWMALFDWMTGMVWWDKKWMWTDFGCDVLFHAASCTFCSIICA